jgi:hypothetical protein
MTDVPDRAQVDELLAFLPALSDPGRRFVLDEVSPAAGSGSQLRIPHPTYADDVVAFFMLIGTEPWIDRHYRRLRPEDLVADPGRIPDAGYAEVRALLNHCSRGERFCDGYWLEALEEGIVQAALRRLAALVDQGPAVGVGEADTLGDGGGRDESA